MKFKSEVQLEALNNATVDTDKFLVSDSSTVKYRTGAQLLSDLGIAGIYVPYTGATGNVDLGTHTLSSYNLIVNHTSGSGVAASITKGGNGEVLTINKTSGSGNAMSVTGGLTSLVDLTLSSIANATTDTDRFIVSDGGAIKYRTGAQVLSDIGGQPALTNPITGTGTTNYLSKFTGTTSLGDSQIFDNGTNVGIGTASPTAKLSIGGVGSALSFDTLGVPGTTEIKTIQDYELSIKNNRGSSTEILVGNEILKFSTSELERMRITSGGRVGIGTSAPAEVLGIAGNIELTPGANRYVKINSATNYFYNLQSVNDNFQILAAGTTPRLTITYPNGNVGIGTTSPNAKLEVSAGQSFINQDYLLGWNVSGSATLRAYIIGTSGNELQFWNRQGGTNTQAITLNASGNVGIGTTSPSAKLHISGSGNTETIIDSTAAGSSILTMLSSSGGSNLIGYGPSGPLRFGTVSGPNGTGLSEKMRIDANGNVGIGTSSPYTKLDVSGAIRSSAPDNPTVYYAELYANYDSANLGGVRTSQGNLIRYASDNSATYVGVGDTMTIKSGNVGVGTTTPDSKLDVTGGDITVNTSGTGFMNFKYGTVGSESAIGTVTTDGINISYNASSALTFGTAGTTERMRINSSGQLLVGTSSGYGSNGKVVVQNGTIIGASSTWNNSTTGCAIEIFGNDAANGGIIWASKNGNQAWGDISIAPSGGNVGIGTSSPARPLTVASSNIGIRMDNSSNSNAGLEYYVSTGTFHNWLLGAQYNVSNTFEITPSTTVGGTTYSTPAFVVNANGNVGVGDTAPSDKFVVDGRARINGANALAFGNSAGGYAQIAVSGATTGNLVFSTYDGVSLGERMRISLAGNVGIGTSSPSNKLEVNGNAYFSTGSSYAAFQSTFSINSNYAGYNAGIDSNLGTLDSNYNIIIRASDNGNTYTAALAVQSDGTTSTGTTNRQQLSMEGLLQTETVPSDTTTPVKWIKVYNVDDNTHYFIPAYQ